MAEFFERLFSLSILEVLADLHGGLAMLAMVLFGAAFALFFSLNHFKRPFIWLRNVLLVLWVNLTILNMLGLYIYIPYRVKGGPRSLLLANEETSWLHKIIFEHKEFLAFAPMIMIFTALMLLTFYRQQINAQPTFRKIILVSLVASLLFILVVATEAVLVTKTAPLR